MKILILILVLGLASCGRETKKKSSEVRQDVSAIYAASTVKVQVFYEPGAEPYTDGPLNLKYWSILEQNLEALFQGSSPSKTIKVPKALSEMSAMSAFNKTSWKIEDVLEMSKGVPTAGSSDAATFSVFFVKGSYSENPKVIGFHITNTKLMVVFKDVIKSVPDQTSFGSKYLEQATIIHELGHALGLVNNGLPMKSAHHDSEHGAHCDNPKCVMYYTNEGTSNMLAFLAQVLQSSSTVMFDANCLQDSQSYTGSGK
jgi:predicted Zn-dependent protease